MGRKVLLAAICWLMSSSALGEPKKTVISSVAKDNESAESAPRRLYHNVPVGVYASAAPHGAFSYQVPTVLRSPHPPHSQQAASTHIAPVKGGSVLIPSDEFLQNIKDSYGKQVQASGHAATYKAAFPQQFVPLQELPAHLAQPLVSASPGYQFKTVPNYFFGPQSYKVSALHLTEPMVYAQDLKNFGPLHNYQAPGNTFPTASQTTEHKSHLRAPVSHEEKKSERVQQEKPKAQAITPKNKDTKHVASNTVKTSVTAIVNGKKTVVNIDTKPPLPLIDLNLLEPLKFDNPLVPQIQNYLPKISLATYHKLPSFNVKDAEKKHQKDIIVTKTKSYDSGFSKIKPYNITPKKKPITKPKQQTPLKPSVSVKGVPNGDEFSYEINTPNHKEVYNEQVLNYNKETNMKPVDYSYNEQSHKEPEVYTYVHSSKSPLKVTHVEYNSDDDGPKTLVYNLSPEEQGEEKEDIRQNSSEESDESGESSAESEEGPEPQSQYKEPPKHNPHHHLKQQELPKYTQHNEHHATGHHAIGHHENGHHENGHHGKDHHANGQYENSHHGKDHHANGHHENGHHGKDHHANGHHDAPQHLQHPVSYEVAASPRPFQHQYNFHNDAPKTLPQPQYYILQQGPAPPKPTQQTIQFGHTGAMPNPFLTPPQPTFQLQHLEALKPTQHHGNHQTFQVHHEPPSQQLKPEHRGQEYQQKSNVEIIQGVIHTTPRYFSQPIVVKSQNNFQPITPEYEQDIRILPTHQPHAPIKVEHKGQSHNGPIITHFHNIHPSSAPHRLPPQQEHPATLLFKPHSSTSPHIQEKSKRIIIKEKEETPDEMHTHTEQLRAEMADREENSEEDFEKAYKESAFGFPAYEEMSEEIEKDIYNPETYGAPQYHKEYKISDSPFEQYQEDGDQFPKSARLAYKDAREDNKEDYFLDFSVNKPESLTDRAKSKLNYYKMFKKQRPEKVYVQFGDNNNKKEKKSEKFTVAPSFDFFGSSSKPKAKQSKIFAQYKAVPIKYEYDYSKEAPRDSSAYASRPYHKYRTHFVEPQFQYGFNPITSIAVDSELAAMASNDSPESEKPGTRKKIYKENWYIKKTSTTGNKPS